jgi:teichuronic acid biosynthesis glycosyltransferase TuaG
VPKISIITPVYNAERFLPQLFISVQSQTYQDFEHIIVDDCSTDSSYELIKHYASRDSRVKVLRHQYNLGVVKARNTAVNISKGRFMAFLDADDIWLPEKLSVQINCMIENGAVLSFTDYRFVSEDGKSVGKRIKGPSKIGWRLHHMTRYLGCLTVMVDRKQVHDFSFGTISSAYRAEDFLAWSKIINEYGSASRCPHDLARYTVVKNSRSSDGVKAAMSVWALYRKIEKIPLVTSAIYFSCYILFSSLKRYLFRPRFDRVKNDFL